LISLVPGDDHKQALRVKRFLMAFVTYVIWMLIALFYYYDGFFVRLPWPLYWTFTLIITTNLLIFTMIRSGWSRRLKDPSLTMVQMVLATVWILYLAYCLDTGGGSCFSSTWWCSPSEPSGWASPVLSAFHPAVRDMPP
jgi:hypothetical protein